MTPLTPERLDYLTPADVTLAWRPLREAFAHGHHAWWLARCPLRTPAEVMGLGREIVTFDDGLQYLVLEDAPGRILAVGPRRTPLERGDCSVTWEEDGAFQAPRVRAVLVAHGFPAREVHASTWSQDRDRALREVERWAQRNNLTIVATLPPSPTPAVIPERRIARSESVRGAP